MAVAGVFIALIAIKKIAIYMINQLQIQGDLCSLGADSSCRFSFTAASTFLCFAIKPPTIMAALSWLRSFTVGATLIWAIAASVLPLLMTASTLVAHSPVFDMM